MDTLFFKFKVSLYEIQKNPALVKHQYGFNKCKSSNVFFMFVKIQKKKKIQSATEGENTIVTALLKQNRDCRGRQ
jgi:hypothetical protein